MYLQWTAANPNFQYIIWFFLGRGHEWCIAQQIFEASEEMYFDQHHSGRVTSFPLINSLLNVDFNEKPWEMLLAFFFFILPSVGHLYSAQTRIVLWGEHLNREKIFVICHTLKLNFWYRVIALEITSRNLHAEKSTWWGKLLNQLLHNTVLNPLSPSSL